MKASQKAFNLLEKWEEFRANPYQDSKGVWTYAYGHTRTVQYNTPPITRYEAEQLLKQDVSIVEEWINIHFKKLRQCQFDALVSLLFNIGGDNEFLKTTTAQYLKTDPDSRFVAYNWIEFTLSGGVYQRGLLRRRIDELELYYSWK